MYKLNNFRRITFTFDNQHLEMVSEFNKEEIVNDSKGNEQIFQQKNFIYEEFEIINEVEYIQSENDIRGNNILKQRIGSIEYEMNLTLVCNRDDIDINAKAFWDWMNYALIEIEKDPSKRIKMTCFNYKNNKFDTERWEEPLFQDVVPISITKPENQDEQINNFTFKFYAPTNLFYKNPLNVSFNNGGGDVITPEDTFQNTLNADAFTLGNGANNIHTISEPSGLYSKYEYKIIDGFNTLIQTELSSINNLPANFQVYKKAGTVADSLGRYRTLFYWHDEINTGHLFIYVVDNNGTCHWVESTKIFNTKITGLFMPQQAVDDLYTLTTVGVAVFQTNPENFEVAEIQLQNYNINFVTEKTQLNFTTYGITAGWIKYLDVAKNDKHLITMAGASTNNGIKYSLYKLEVKTTIKFKEIHSYFQNINELHLGSIEFSVPNNAFKKSAPLWCGIKENINIAFAEEFMWMHPDESNGNDMLLDEYNSDLSGVTKQNRGKMKNWADNNNFPFQVTLITEALKNTIKEDLTVFNNKFFIDITNKNTIITLNSGVKIFPTTNIIELSYTRQESSYNQLQPLETSVMPYFIDVMVLDRREVKKIETSTVPFNFENIVQWKIGRRFANTVGTGVSIFKTKNEFEAPTKIKITKLAPPTSNPQDFYIEIKNDNTQEKTRLELTDITALRGEIQANGAMVVETDKQDNRLAYFETTKKDASNFININYQGFITLLPRQQYILIFNNIDITFEYEYLLRP